MTGETQQTENRGERPLLQRWDLHVHTSLSDGAADPETVIQTAIRKGLTAIGISDHSYTVYDAPENVIPRETESYRTQVRELAEKYRGTIRVLCGIEQDYYSGRARGFDYAIGSVHALKVGEGRYVPTDLEAGAVEGVKNFFDGDWYAFAEEYFRHVARIVEVTGANIIGHLDVIAKCNRGGRYFDEQNPRYVRAWKEAVDKLLKAGVPFEINTGAVSRGYCTEPHPTAQIRGYIRERGGKMLLASDAHRPENIAFGFDREY